MNEADRIARLRLISSDNWAPELDDAADALTRLQQELKVAQEHAAEWELVAKETGRLGKQAEATVSRLTAALREIEKVLVKHGSDPSCASPYQADLMINQIQPFITAALAPADPEKKA